VYVYVYLWDPFFHLLGHLSWRVRKVSSNEDGQDYYSGKELNSPGINCRAQQQLSSSFIYLVPSPATLFHGHTIEGSFELGSPNKHYVPLL
jgi:hypothetical protein